MSPPEVNMESSRYLHENDMNGFQRPRFSRTLVRCLIFAVIFVMSAAVSLTYTYMRPPVYESAAQLLLSPDLSGTDGNMEGGAAVQDVAVQSQVLLSRELLTQVLDELSESGYGENGFPKGLSELQSMVKVTPVEKSTIVKLRAEGPDKDVLPVIVNNWLDLYLEKNSQMQNSKSDAAAESLQKQIDELQGKLARKQEELNSFREKFDIVSMQREENQVLSELKGLNAALNKATETKVTAEANLVAIREAIDNGKWAGNTRKPREIVRLEEQAESLQEVVNEYEVRYTPKYLRLDKDARTAFKKLERLEEKIRLVYAENRKAAIEEAEQEIVSANSAYAALEDKLAANKKKVAQFSKRFSEYESLKEELNQLESFSHDKKEALVAMEIKSTADIVQVKLLERAFVPQRPIRPDYLRDAGLSLALSVFLGILAVLCFELFTRPVGGWPKAGMQSVTYNQILPNAQPVLKVSSGNDMERLAITAMEQTVTRELAEAEVQALVRASDTQTQLLIAAILNGLSPGEIARLKEGDIKGDPPQIHVTGESSRSIVASHFFTGTLKSYMPGEPDAGQPLFRDSEGKSLAVAEMELLLAKAAALGLGDAAEVTSQALRHTYIAFLVRQGARPEEIAQLTGPLSTADKTQYEIIKPPGPGIPLAKIKLTYPVQTPGNSA